MTQTDMIAVNYAQLAQVESELATSQRSIQAALDTLNSDLAPLFATWQGQGFEAYRIQQERWDAAAAELNHTLQLVHRAVGEANERYQFTDRRVAAAWSGG
jgi:WXG100 family type VII secretion target